MSSDSGQATVFLSYAHGDQAQAQRLAAALERRGYTVWWDALIEGGTRFAKSIDEALDSGRRGGRPVVEASVESDWVRDEAAQGRDRHRLVPLSLDGSAPPLGFRQIQMIDLSGWRGRADAPQIEAIAAGDRRGDRAGSRRGQRQASQAGSTRRQAMATAAACGRGRGRRRLVAWETVVRPGGARARSIAVLPFKNLSGDAGQAYLSDGLTEEIRSALARNAGLRVLAATSSNTVRDMTGDASIARKLGVAYLLEGSVQRAGDIVRVGDQPHQRQHRLFRMVAAGRAPAERHFRLRERDRARRFPMPCRCGWRPTRPRRAARATSAPTRPICSGKALYNLAKDEATDRQAKADYRNRDRRRPGLRAGPCRAVARACRRSPPHMPRRGELKPIYAQADRRRRSARLRSLRRWPRAIWRLAMPCSPAGSTFRGARPSYDKAYQYGRGNADIVLLYARICGASAPFRGGARRDRSGACARPAQPADASRGRERSLTRRAAMPMRSTQYRRALELNPKMSNAKRSIGR